MGLGAISNRGTRFFSSPQHPSWLLGHPTSYPLGAAEYSGSLKWPESDADHFPLSGTEVKNGEAVLPFPIHLNSVEIN
jgi:hypothetical protein